MPTIKFIKEKKEIEAPAGANLRQAAFDNGINVHHHATSLTSRFMQAIKGCRGNGLCGTCNVLIKKGMENCSPVTTIEKINMATSMYSIGKEDEVRLACQVKVNGDIEVETHSPLNLFGEAFWEQKYYQKAEKRSEV